GQARRPLSRILLLLATADGQLAGAIFARKPRFFETPGALLCLARALERLPLLALDAVGDFVDQRAIEAAEAALPHDVLGSDGWGGGQRQRGGTRQRQRVESHGFLSSRVRGSDSGIAKN